MKKTILVTGALGHIGSALIKSFDPQLVQSVLILDNLESQRYCSLVNLPKTFSYRFYQEDIRTADMASFVKQADIVIHLAAITNAEGSFDRQKEVEEVNFEGLRRVAEACTTTKIPLLFPSTTSVYGSQEKRVDETCSELKPQSPYAAAKLESEQLLTTLGKKGLPFIICRFGTIFGPSVGMRFHTAVNKFIWQAINGLPITVWKTAWQQRRPYLDLQDCISAVNFILQKELFNQELYNVLTHNFSVEEIVNAIKHYAPQLTVSYVDSPIMNQLSYDVDDSKFRQLGFVPAGDLDRGIRETFEQFSGIQKYKL